ncbi:MAG: hypothetical protein EHM45_16340 [Desulfobacteraceae bacterium]|nr:MAG: hypothetical protein EHM45_16340 [Desulfobacteraceae bacterium]
MKNFLFRFRTYLFFFSIYLIAFGCVTSEKLITRGPVQPQVVRDVRKTIDLFNEIMKNDLDIKLLKPVPVYVAADTAAYRRVLSNEFKLSKDELPQWSDSTGFSTYTGVAMDASKSLMDNAKDRCSVTAHELFHQLQYTIMGGHRSEDPRFFQEGTAELIGARVAEQFGFTRVQDWRKEVLNEVRAMPNPATVQELRDADEADAWHKLIEQKKHPYGVSALMVISLFDLSQKNVYKGLGDYGIQIGMGKDIDTAFSRAFGLSYKQFLKDFDAWYAAALAQPAEIEIVPDCDAAAASVAETRQAFTAAQLFLKERRGAPLKSSPRILLASGRPGAVSFLEKEFGLETSAAQEYLADGKSFPFYWNGSTALLNLNDDSVRESLTFSAASVFLRMHYSEMASRQPAEGVFWLLIGDGDLTAALITDACRKKSLAEQKKTWLKTVLNAADRPRLDRLHTKKEWERAFNKFSRAVLYSYIRLAALYLSETGGYQALTEWQRRTEQPDTEKAFEKIFGIPLNRFELDFENYLREQLKTV